MLKLNFRGAQFNSHKKSFQSPLNDIKTILKVSEPS